MREGIIAADNEKDGREEEQVVTGVWSENFKLAPDRRAVPKEISRVFPVQLRPFHLVLVLVTASHAPNESFHTHKMVRKRLSTS